MRILDWLFRREPPIRMEEEKPMIEMSPRMRIRYTTVEIEDAKNDVAEGIRSVREGRQSLDATIQQILLIKAESTAILESRNRNEGDEDEPPRPSSIDGRQT